MVAYINEKKNVPADKSVTTVIMPTSVKIAEASHFVNRIQSMVEADSSLRILSDALHAFASIPSSCTVLIAPGIHRLENLGGLSFGGVLKGIATIF